MFEYHIRLDHNNPNFEKKYEAFNHMFIRSQFNYLNDLLIARGFVFLKDVQECLGVPITRSAVIAGWTYKKDGHIDFEMKSLWSKENLEAIIITLNVPQESILYMIKED